MVIYQKIMDIITELASEPPPDETVTVAIPADGFVKVTAIPVPAKLRVLTLFAVPTIVPSFLKVNPLIAFAGAAASQVGALPDPFD